MKRAIVLAAALLALIAGGYAVLTVTPRSQPSVQAVARPSPAPTPQASPSPSPDHPSPAPVVTPHPIASAPPAAIPANRPAPLPPPAASPSPTLPPSPIPSPTPLPAPPSPIPSPSPTILSLTLHSTLWTPQASVPNGGFAVQVQTFLSDGTGSGAVAGACGQVVSSAGTVYKGCTTAPPPAWTFRASTVPLFAVQFATLGETMVSITMTYGGVTTTCTPPCGL